MCACSGVCMCGVVWCVFGGGGVCVYSHLLGETSMSKGLLAAMVGEMAGMGKRVVVMRPKKSSTSR